MGRTGASGRTGGNHGHGLGLHAGLGLGASTVDVFGLNEQGRALVAKLDVGIE